MRSWIVAQSQSLRQERAEDHLTRQGAEVYLPRCKVTTIKNGKRTTREEFLFGTYLFVRPAGDAWLFVLGTQGVRDVVRQGEDPGTVPDKVVQRLKAREEDGFVQLPVSRGYLLGQRVRVTKGPFQDHVGAYGGGSLERELVLLSVMGRETRVSVGAGSLAAA